MLHLIKNKYIDKLCPALSSCNLSRTSISLGSAAEVAEDRSVLMVLKNLKGHMNQGWHKKNSQVHLHEVKILEGWMILISLLLTHFLLVKLNPRSIEIHPYSR